ncbi:unnamed protein product [Cyprideis torosa]|uniref:RNA helicase n=1 Tax=Cyprideis torosa TaxID=163714 RepID=A0A7R8WD61_9CRUS|nr:unnamed protein product [Cyprideis torosa]CAG0894239.1 unnamed protein product [Cyprideis torosa]
MTFEDLGLSPETLKAVKECGYINPTPIQAKAIPAIQMTRDIVGLAQTGTGKTASFTLPMIDALSGGRAKMRMPRSLVLEPTRELAAQVAENFDTYGKYHRLNKALLVGGESMGEQMKLLEQGVDVLIATPGRLLDLFERGHILLNDIRILVIDEADRMMDMGFIPDIEKIVSLIPPMRQTLLFSATMPPEIKKLTEKFLSNPKEISVAPAASPAETRTETLQNFKDDKIKLLVCSDVAARGIDVNNVSHVINYDVPMTADDYVHRIGRTGRAGNKGRAWMMTTDRDEKFLVAIQRLIKKEFDPVDLKQKTKPNKMVEKPRVKASKPKPSGKSSNDKPSKEVYNDPNSSNEFDDVSAFGDDIPAFLK